MKKEHQELLNEMFLGKEDPDMAFKPMTNNLKEEKSFAQKIVDKNAILHEEYFGKLEYPRLEITPPELTREGDDISIRATADISKYTKDLAKALADKVDEGTKREAKKLGLNILTDKELSTLINQKEKESEIRALEGLLDSDADEVTCVCESASTEVCDHNWSLCNVVRDRIKQLKEELNKGVTR